MVLLISTGVGWGALVVTGFAKDLDAALACGFGYFLYSEFSIQ
jgi:hypothetical protein